MLYMTIRKKERTDLPVPEWSAGDRHEHRQAAVFGIGRGSRLCTSGFLLFLVFALAGSLPIRAEESVLKLSLREAVQLALLQNPQVQIASINLAQSEQDKNTARSALMPQLSAEVSEAVRRSNLEAFTGKSVEGFPKVVGPLQVFQGGGTFAFPIFDLTLWRRWQAAGHAVSGMEAQINSVHERIVLLVVSQYLGCLRAAADVSARKSQVDLAEALYQLAADLQANGVGTRIDELRADVVRQNEKQRLIVAETQAKTSLYALGQLLNIESEKTIELSDTMKFSQTPKIETEETLALAYEARPEMRALDARLKMIQRQKEASRAIRLPSFHADGLWAYQGLSINNSIPIYQYQVRMSLPLFTGGRIKADIAKSDLEEKKVMQEKVDLRNQITLQVKVAIAAIESARNEVDVAELGLKLASEEVVQARDRFEAGVANNIELITAQDELARANDNQINALYRYNQARADLAHASGQMELLYSK
jgi:outer membrane protein